tara:strand:- start:256 stop:4686 length:4431 start_codon:yes stop_codon:yes gene_type:complete
VAYSPIEEALKRARTVQQSGVVGGASPDGRITKALERARSIAPAKKPLPVAKDPEPQRSGDIDYLGRFGDFLDIVDTPRAAVASTFQEIADVFQGEGFSGSDWWQQTSDNYLFGEVLRDVGVTGYLEDIGYQHSWLPGAILDFTFDPVVYGKMAGVAARGLTNATKTAEALRTASNTAKTAKESEAFLKAAKRVETTRSTASAGTIKMPNGKTALDEIGIRAGMGFTMPGTGRFGRQVVENPMNFITRGKGGAKWDQRRIKQLPDFVLGQNKGWVAKNNDKILQAMRLMRRSDEASKAAVKLLDDPIKEAARMASKMAVEAVTLPGTAGIAGAIASVPGLLLNGASRLKLVRAGEKLVNTKAEIRQMPVLTDDPDAALLAGKLVAIRDEGSVAKSTIETILGSEMNMIRSKADELGVDLADIQLASAQPTYLTDEAGNILVVAGREVVNPALPDSIRSLGNDGIEFHKSLVNFWDNAKTSFDDIAGDARFEPLINDMFASRMLKQGNVKNKNNFFKPNTPSRKFRSPTYVGPSQYAKLVEDMGLKRTAKLYKKEFYGEELFDVTGPKGVGIGVQQQMEEIGQRAFGNEWKQMFEDDFFKVAEGYIARLGRYASDTRVATSLENAGQFIPSEISRKNFQGVLWQRLNKSLQKVDTSKAKLKEERRIAVEAQNKITDLEQGAKLDAAASRRVLDELQLTLDDLMEEVSELPEVMLPGSNRAISGIQKNLAEQSKVYAARSSVIGQELDQVNKILTAVRGAQAVADNPALFAQLERNINTIGNALKSYNMGQSKALLADETVAGMKRLEALLKGELDLGPLPKGFDRKDPAVKRFIAWEKIYKEAQKLDTELDASWMQLSRNDQEIFEAQRLIDQEIKNIEDAFSSGMYVNRPVEVQNYIKFQEDAINFQQNLIDTEVQRLQQALGVEARIYGEASENVANLEDMINTVENNKIRALRLDIANAKASPDLKVQLTAAESQAEAIKNINNQRSILGFQENYNIANSNRMTQVGFDDYLSVNTNEFKEVFDDAFLASARINDPQNVKDFLEGYGKFLNWWKAGAIASPGFILRNGQGGVWINSGIAGIEMGLHSKLDSMRRAAVSRGEGPTTYDKLVNGARILRDEGNTISLKKVFGNKSNRTASPDDLRIFSSMVDAGIIGRGQAVSEVASDALGKSGTLNPFSADFYLFQRMRRANERMEFMLRGAVAFDAIAYKGKSLDEAFGLVSKYHFDYADLTNFERRIKKVYPFWKWQKSIIPVLIESMGKNPAAYSRLAQLKGELELDIGEENLWPSYVLERWGIELPLMFKGGRAMTNPDLPFQGFAKMINDPKSAPSELAQGFAPFVKLPIELHFDQQLFGDLPLTGRFQQVPNIYTVIPGVMETLEKLGRAERNSKGEWKMRDNDIYTLEAFNAVLGRSRRIWPNETAKERRWISTMVSFFFGGSLRFHTDADDRYAWYEDQKKLEKDIRDQQDLENRRK